MSNRAGRRHSYCMAREGAQHGDTGMNSNKTQAADAARINQPSRRAQPVRLPQATAELVDRMLAARCGTSHQVGPA